MWDGRTQDNIRPENRSRCKGLDHYTWGLPVLVVVKKRQCQCSKPGWESTWEQNRIHRDIDYLKSESESSPVEPSSSEPSHDSLSSLSESV